MKQNTINGFIITAFRTKDFERLYDKFSFYTTRIIPCTFKHFEMTIVVFYNKDTKENIEILRKQVEELQPLKISVFKPFMVSQDHIFKVLIEHFARDFEENCGTLQQIKI